MSIDYSLFAFPKGVTKKKEKQKVSQSTYDEVVRVCNGKCAICESKKNLKLHHIYYRSEDKSKIDDPKNCIMLCEKCHEKVHNNKKYWKPRLIEIREKLELNKSG